jgi:hypothetical protein
LARQIDEHRLTDPAAAGKMATESGCKEVPILPEISGFDISFSICFEALYAFYDNFIKYSRLVGLSTAVWIEEEEIEEVKQGMADWVLESEK